MGPGEGLGGSGIAPAPVICLSCPQKKTEFSGCLFEGPDFPLEIRKPEAVRQKKRRKKTGLEKQGHKRVTVLPWEQKSWNRAGNISWEVRRSGGWCWPCH